MPCGLPPPGSGNPGRVRRPSDKAFAKYNGILLDFNTISATVFSGPLHKNQKRSPEREGLGEAGSKTLDLAFDILFKNPEIRKVPGGSNRLKPVVEVHVVTEGKQDF